MYWYLNKEKAKQGEETHIEFPAQLDSSTQCVHNKDGFMEKVHSLMIF